jgi:integrase
LSAIAAKHREAGAASPITVDVSDVLFGLRKKLGAAPRALKAALSVEDLRAMLDAPRLVVGPNFTLQPAAPSLVARDRALLLVGFASALRRSELIALDLADVTFERCGVVLRIRRSKTDQEGAGRDVGVNCGKKMRTCPCVALRAWLVERGPAPGPLFCGVSASGAVSLRRLAPSTVAAVVKSAARRAGLDASRYAGHSLRAGCATAAAEHGRDALAIMARTGHRSAAMVERYVRRGSVLRDDVLEGVL